MAMGDPVKIMSVHLAWSEKDLGKDGIWAKTRTAMGSWSSGYDVSLTRRRSPVRIRLSPLTYLFMTLF